MPAPTCPDCKGAGYVTLLTTRRPCGCATVEGADVYADRLRGRGCGAIQSPVSGHFCPGFRIRAMAVLKMIVPWADRADAIGLLVQLGMTTVTLRGTGQATVQPSSVATYTLAEITPAQPPQKYRGEDLALVVVGPILYSIPKGV